MKKELEMSEILSKLDSLEKVDREVQNLWDIEDKDGILIACQKCFNEYILLLEEYQKNE